MDQPLHSYMRLGIVQGVAFRGQGDDPEGVLRSIETIAADDAFAAIELRYIPDDGLRRRIVDVLRASRLGVVYEAHPRMQSAGLDLGSTDTAARTRAVEGARRAIDEAIQVAAERVNLCSGPDPGPAEREAAGEAFLDSLCELASYAADNGGPPLALAPLVRNGAGGALIGPAREAVSLVHLVREVYPTFGLTLDTAHMALQHEETGATLALAAPYLGQLHLANVIPGAGNTAPPFGVLGGVYDVPRVSETLLALFRVGFLGTGRRPLVCFRVAPQAGERPEWVIAGAKRTLGDAWARL